MFLEAVVVRSIRDRWRSLVAWQVGIVALVAVQMSVYPTVRDTSSDWEGAVESFPEVFREIFRMEDYTSPEGYLSTELLSFVVPFIFMTLGASWGARATSDDEEKGTADILLSLPITRRSFLLSRWLSGVLVLVATSLVFALSLWVGGSVLDMNISVDRYANASVMLCFTGFASYTLAATVGTATGRRGVGLGVTMVCLVAGFVFYSLAPLVGFFEAVNPYNPLQWMLGAQPLTSGLAVGYVALLATFGAAGLAASNLVFERRDIQV